VAGPYARYDPQGALTWLATFKGEPVYDAAFPQVVSQAAQSDPRAAARMLDESPPSGSAAGSLVSRVASVWARQEPAAAIEWALRRADAPQRTTAVQAAATSWAQRDASAAGLWARSAPSAVRDTALQGVLNVMASSGTVDHSLFAAFNSDSARQQAARQIVGTLATRDPTQARAVLDAYITDPALRQAAEQQMERSQSGNISNLIRIIR
jgi:hypothetical protein